MIVGIQARLHIRAKYNRLSLNRTRDRWARRPVRFPALALGCTHLKSIETSCTELSYEGGGGVVKYKKCKHTHRKRGKETNDQEGPRTEIEIKHTYTSDTARR